MQEEVIAYYSEIKKQNKIMLNQMKSNQKKQDRKELMKLLKVFVDIELLTYSNKEIPSDC
jgi:hypothetical protein